MSTSKKINTIFIGTPDFAVPSLLSIINDESFDLKAVITQPDKKQGRKQVLVSPPVKKLAKKYKIPVFQPESIKNFEFNNENIDLIVVVAYAQIIPKRILLLPKYGCVNVHGSLLPYCRGASCVQGPIIDGKNETGITLMLMDEGLDTGPILKQFKTEIKKDDTAGTIFDKLSLLGKEHLAQTLKDYVEGKIEASPQKACDATYMKMLKKSDGKIDWNQDAIIVERFIRAMQPWPGAFSIIENKTLKILKASSAPKKINEYKPGEIFCENSDFCVQCKKDSLIIKEMQLEGKKALKSSQFVCGNSQLIGKILS